MADNNYLFSDVDSFRVQGDRRSAMRDEIASINGNRLLNTNVDDLVDYFAEKFGIEVPELLEDKMLIDQQEAQWDVSGDPLRLAYHLKLPRPYGKLLASCARHRRLCSVSRQGVEVAGRLSPEGWRRSA